jgi:sugar lactone lactonase YvrE
MTARYWSAAAVVALALPLLPASAGAAPEVASHVSHRVVDRIDLPNGWQPEGITTDGEHLYVGSLANGAIWKANPHNGHGRVLAEGVTGRVAVGVDYDPWHNLIWVAGGATNTIRAHNARTGRVRATYTFPSATPQFLNDLVVTRKGVFATDSSSNQRLAVVPFRKDGSLRPARAARTLTLTGDLVYTADLTDFELNGIVRKRGRLLAVQSSTGKLFRINKRTGVTHAVDLGGYTLTNGDGLEIHRRTLFVVRNQNELVAQLRLNRRLSRATLVRELTSPDLDFPTTVALQDGQLWAVNARFTTPATPTTAYWVTRVPR